MFLKFDHFSHSMWSSNSGHEPEKGGHMIPIALQTCGISKHTFSWSESSKKAMVLIFDYFSHSMWSSNCGHEHEEGGQMNPMVHYWS